MIISHKYDIDLRGWAFYIETKEGHCSNIFLSSSHSEIEKMTYLVNWLNKSFIKFEQFRNDEEETPSQSV